MCDTTEGQLEAKKIHDTVEGAKVVTPTTGKLQGKVHSI